MNRTLGNGREVTDKEREQLTGIAMVRGRVDTVLAVNNLTHFLCEHENKVLFQATEPCKGYWRFWNSRYWQKYNEITLRGDIDWLFNGELTNTRLNELINTMKNKVSVPFEAFDKKPIVVFRDEVWQAHENRLSKYKPGFQADDLVTVGLPFSPKPMRTPIWKSMLDQVLPNPKDQATLQEMWGYTHFPSLSKQVFFVLHGPGGTGKDTLMTILRMMIGEERCSTLPLKRLGEPHESYALSESIVNFDGEAEGLERAGELLLKQISGDSAISINPKWMQPYSKTVPVKFVLACNNLPHFFDRSDAIWSRYVQIPFNVPVPQSNHKKAIDLFRQLEPELDGIMAWALLGLDRVLKTGKYRAAAFTQSEQAAQQIADHKTDSNPFLLWYQESVGTVPDAPGLPRPEVYAHYRHWMIRNGHSPMVNTNFGKEMKRMGVEVKRKKRPPEWYGGIELLEPEIYKMERA